MSDTHRKRIHQLAWQSKAKSSRKNIEAVLASCSLYNIDFEFIDEEKTQEFGNEFWRIVKSIEEVNVSSFSQCSNVLLENYWPEKVVIYFHSNTRESGAIQIALVDLLTRASCLQERLGPDFLFMDPMAEFGFCYEEGETYHVYRAWGYQRIG